MAFAASQTRSKEMAEINITPLVDVMLVLLIIFLVAAPALVKHIELPLPQAVPPKLLPVEPDPLRLSLDDAGVLRLDGRELGWSTLQGVLRIESARGQQPRLQIDMAADTPHAQVTRLLALVNDAGMQRLELQLP
ncbi:MAG: biopolymer transporter ExbD [Aquimonas sp.]|nr:biopolymer transporter ExbD [Aquimonas sp.]